MQRVCAFYLLLFFFLTSCQKKDETDIILDVRSVINKRPEEVIKILGEPDTTYTEMILGKSLFCQRYAKHNIEIQYPESLSTDIVIYGPHELPFTQSALKAFDIHYQKKHPSQYEKDVLMRWYDFDEFETISFYNVQKDSSGQINNYNIFFKARKN
jgi:hypothetical protein